MTAMKFRYSPSELPAEFDARDKWPGKIQVGTHVEIPSNSQDLTM